MVLAPFRSFRPGGPCGSVFLASSECGVTPDHAGLATVLLYPGATQTFGE